MELNKSSEKAVHSCCRLAKSPTASALMSLMKIAKEVRAMVTSMLGEKEVFEEVFEELFEAWSVTLPDLEMEWSVNGRFYGC